jgi:lysozyme family protein
MAVFEKALPGVLKHEGFYVNHPNDPGAETYAGISRKHWPNWAGWAIVDREKREQGGKLPRNYKIEDYNLQLLIASFYKKYWNESRAGEIQNDALAQLYFDHAVNAGNGRAATILQRAIGRAGNLDIVIDGAIGPKTIAAANRISPEKLYPLLMEERKFYYQRLAQQNPSLAVFLKGWMNRLSSFDIGTATAGGGLVLALVLTSAYLAYKGLVHV